MEWGVWIQNVVNETIHYLGEIAKQLRRIADALDSGDRRA